LEVAFKSFLKITSQQLTHFFEHLIEIFTSLQFVFFVQIFFHFSRLVASNSVEKLMRTNHLLYHQYRQQNGVHPLETKLMTLIAVITDIYAISDRFEKSFIRQQT
jgi:hypothetical protein